MATLQQFEDLVGRLMSPDNAARAQAEAIFESMKQNPDSLVTSLVQLIRQSQHVEVRSYAAVVLRKLLTPIEKSLWQMMSPAVKALTQTELIRGIEQEPVTTVRHKICDTAGEMASELVKRNEWPELVPQLMIFCKAPAAEHREAGHLVFAQLSNFMAESGSAHTATLMSLFSEGLADKQSVKVRVAALMALTNLLTQLEGEQCTPYQPLVPNMLECISAALQANEDESTRSALQVLCALAENEPRFLKKHLQLFVGAMCSMGGNTQLEDGIRQLALETLLLLAENAPGMCRIMGTFVQQVFPVALGMMTEVDEDPEWNVVETEPDEDSNQACGEQSLDRLAMALGGKAVTPVAFTMIGSFLQSQDWHHRYAALMAVSVTGEGCMDVIITQLAQVTSMVVQFFRDPHPYVRFAACNAIGQMCTDFGPTLQDEHHATILPALIELMNDHSNPRVMAHSAAAVINFAAKADTQILTPYLDALLLKLLALLQTGQKMVQEQAITAVASVADSAEAAFVKYYDTFMPLLKHILLHATTKEFRMLRGKAMECISLIGMAVGAEKFMADAKEIMDVMMHTQAMHLEPDDPQIGYMLQAWARICSVLKEHFVPYLGVVVPPLLRSAGLKPDVQIRDADDEEDLQSQEGWETVVLGDKLVGIRTSALEEKATACSLIGCYISDLDAAFYPHVQETVGIMVPLLKYYAHEEIRTSAAQLFPDLVNCVKQYNAKAGVADQTNVVQLAHYLAEALLNAMPNEPDLEVLCEEIEALRDIIKNAGPGVYNPTQLNGMKSTLGALLVKSEQRRSKLAQANKDEFFDEEVAEEVKLHKEKEDDLVSQVSETLGALIKLYREQFMPMFDEMAQGFAAFLTADRSENDFIAALCVFDDVIEFGGPSALKYIPHLMPVFLACTQHMSPYVRQAAVYGMGMCSQFGGASFAAFVTPALEAISALLSRPDARDKVNILVTENASAALGRMLLFSGVNPAQLWPVWLNNQPTVADDEEAPHMANMLIAQVEARNQYVLGASNEGVPRIVYSLLKYIIGRHPDDSRKELLNDVLRARCAAMLQQLRAALPAQAQAGYAQLTAEEMQEVARLNLA